MPNGHVLDVEATLTAEQHAAIHAALGLAPSRYKGSSHYVFGDLDSGQTERASAVLREHGIAHTLTVEWSWQP